ncbi:hypothetical protein VKT23_007935 [Stygiomarasmius scandens]|uniref:DUF8212 domain-containing protein n=1 Tax=Marasmiellus scandens TaxID=2682957 RepID=A0ABR1JQ04_9AGAR
MYAVFLDKEWKEIGTRWSLRDVISVITSIPVQVFHGKSIDEFSVAQKMSWAAFRETTRPEDQAYCLMGLFNVSMSPIYGEGGAKAFIRLQQEIIKSSDDRSIFAWASVSKKGEDEEEEEEDLIRGLFARSPLEFRASGKIKIPEVNSLGNKSSFSFTNNGLNIHLPLISDDEDDPSIFLAPLHCQTVSEDGITNGLSIYLKKIGEQYYVRYYPDKLLLTSPNSPELEDLREVIVKENSRPRQAKRRIFSSETLAFKIKTHFPSNTQYQLNLIDKHPFDRIHFDRHRMRIEVEPMCVLLLSNSEGSNLLEVGFAQLHLTFNGTGQASEEVYIAFGVQNNIGMVGVDSSVHRIVPRKGVPADRAVLYRRDRKILSVGLQMTGQWSKMVLELDHYSSQDNTLETSLIAPHLMHPPSLGFIQVPLSYWGFDFGGVFPSHFLDHLLDLTHSHGAGQSFESYLSMITETANVPFRLLTYTSSRLVFYVALGFYETGDAWVDAFTAPHGPKATPEAIWKFYFDSNTWKQPPHSASIDILSADFRKTVKVMINRSTTLQIGSHILVLSS